MIREAMLAGRTLPGGWVGVASFAGSLDQLMNAAANADASRTAPSVTLVDGIA
jgi:hypothetical protein